MLRPRYISPRGAFIEKRLDIPGVVVEHERDGRPVHARPLFGGSMVFSRRARNWSWRRKLTSVLVAVVVSGIGVFGSTGAAVAAPADCELGLQCNYSGYDYGNDFLQGPHTHKFANCADNMYIGLRPYKNIASSAFNNGRRAKAYLYSGARQMGISISFFKGTGARDLGARGFNDTMESGYFESTLTKKGTTLCR